MIQAYKKADGELIADSIPKVGDTIHIIDWGDAEVVDFFHTTRKNYIKVRVSLDVGKSTCVWPFTVEQ